MKFLEWPKCLEVHYTVKHEKNTQNVEETMSGNHLTTVTAETFFRQTVPDKWHSS